MVLRSHTQLISNVSRIEKIVEALKVIKHDLSDEEALLLAEKIIASERKKQK